MSSSTYTLSQACEPETIAVVRALFIEYAQSLNVNLYFQDFDTELANLPGEYVAPRGILLIVQIDSSWAGCCALRPLDTVDYPNASEMKRLYVRPQYRGCGIGRALAEAVLDAARSADYSYVLLDTLSDMESARSLYDELGFVEIAPYYHNPLAGAHYLMATL